AALMSTASTLMLTVSGLLLHNVYKPLVAEKSEYHYVWASRILGALFLVGGAIVATQFDSILEILKFIWEFFVIFAAAFWLGLKWRRANRQGAWASILVTMAVFYLLPVIMPYINPAMRTNELLLLKTQPQPVERVYVAREMDVLERNKEIANWNTQNISATSVSVCPDSLKVGDKFTKTFNLPQKSIFWSKDPSVNENGVTTARGYFFPELILIQKLGFQLQYQPYALNETIRMIIRLLFPFLLLIVVSLLTKPQNDKQTLEFFIKMRTRVRGFGNEVDRQDVQNAINNQEATKDFLLFPNSSFEIYKWNRQDVVGFFISIGIVFVVLATLFLAVKMGG
ncbi:MAG: hypothetical protein M0P66_01985, partial [Salinivirgaceae bacterium]|nr:hypothetical protein [Salinivirgaceae bacterium]